MRYNGKVSALPARNNFAEWFNAQLNARNLSQRQAAILLNVAESQVSRWRQGIGGISLESLERIATAFGVDRQELAVLALLRDSGSASTEATVDPTMAALLDAERDDVHDQLSGVDPKYWSVVLDAGRVARQAAAKVARMAAPPSDSATDGQSNSASPDNSSKFSRGALRRAGKPQSGGYPLPVLV